MRHVRACKLSEEDILSALDQIAIYHHRPANCSLPEWHIKYMMKAKWDQCPFDDTEDQGSKISGSGHQSAQGKDAVLNSRPDKVHKDSYAHVNYRRNDRYKPGTAEE